jgi:hypothetical protein
MANKLNFSPTHLAYSIVAVTIFLFTGCKVGDIATSVSAIIKSSKVTVKHLSDKEAVSVISLKYSRKPATVRTFSFGNRQYIAATIDSAYPITLVILSSFANDWLEIFKFGHEYESNKFDSIQFTTIDNAPYLSYFYHTSGSGGEFGSFVLFSLLSKDTFKIGYEILYTTGETKLNEIPAKVSANPSVLSALETLIKKSGYFEKEDGEIDINSGINARKKWLADNPRIYNQIKHNSKVEYSFSKYKENLCKETSINKGGVIDSSENNDFKVWVFFRGSCIGYQKATQEYFIIWVPEDPYDCFNSLKIDNVNDPKCLKIDNTNQVLFNLGKYRQVYLVDLINSTVSLLRIN